MSCGPRTQSSPVASASSRAPLSGSTTTASVLGTNRPAEPWHTGSDGSVIGAASLIPSPCATVQPSRSSQSRSMSAGHGAALSRINRSDERS